MQDITKTQTEFLVEFVRHTKFCFNNRLYLLLFLRKLEKFDFIKNLKEIKVHSIELKIKHFNSIVNSKEFKNIFKY